MLAGISLLYQFHYTRYRTTSVDIIPEPAPVPVIIPSTDLLVTFDTDSARVDERYYPDLRELVALMNEYPEIGVLLEGHTDSRGSAAYNQELAERRALAVRELLVDGLGIAPERVSTKAYGLTKPIADNQSIEGRAANRRVTAEIVFPSD
jgi:OOP family OmpA-OmpF porin